MKPNYFFKNLKSTEFFILFALFWIGLGWLGTILALLGIFYPLIMLLYILCGIFILGYRLYFNPPWRKLKARLPVFAVISFSITVIFILSFYTTPTIFSGRDQGAISEAAIRLSQNHRLPFSFEAEKEIFNIYGEGLALHFPGFAYTREGELITQFPAGYVSWLGIFYSFFGLSGIIVANGVSAIIFILSFYFLCRNYLRPSRAIVAVAGVLVSFTFSWFFKFTLSENFALALIWFGLYAIVALTLTRKKIYLISFLLSFGLLLFVRIEAIALLAAGIGVLWYHAKRDKNKFWSQAGKRYIILLGIILLLYAGSALINIFPYLIPLKSLAKPLLSPGGRSASSPLLSLTPLLYAFRMLTVYALFPFVILGLSGVGIFLYKKRFNFLIPFLVLAPAFFYLWSPHISSDHPWALRRFAFAVIPVSIFYSVWFLDWALKRKALFYAASIALILLNLKVSLAYLTASPHRGLLSQVEEISRNFSSRDIVFVDAKATGDNWSMMTGPLHFLYGIQAVYFLNPHDLGRINLNRFDSVYFIIPDNNLDDYEKNGLLKMLSPVKEYRIQNEILRAKALNKRAAYRTAIKLPEKRIVETRGAIYKLFR